MSLYISDVIFYINSNYATGPFHATSIPFKKHRKPVRFSDVFRGWGKAAMGTNGLSGTLINVNLGR